MSRLALMCRTATPFSAAEGGVDETALRWHLNHLMASNIGICPGGGGVGETYTMSMQDVRRYYEICVDECRGKAPVFANPGERLTAKATLETIELAFEAGCDFANIYPVAGWHGMFARDSELIVYYDYLLQRLKKPILLSVNPVSSSGRIQSASLMASVVNKYPQVVGMYLIGSASNETYLLELMDRINRKIDYYVQLNSSQDCFSIGATGMTCVPANIIPQSFRQYIDHYESGNADELRKVHAGLLRFQKVIEKYKSTEARWVKMCWHVLRMPGAVFHEPYVMPDERELEAFAGELLKVGLPEIDALARGAGLV